MKEKIKFEKLRVPKGTQDIGPERAKTHEYIIDKVVSIFKEHNAVPIQTPMFELRDILKSKYGEDEKLIFDLEDQGGDICSLRYDLTVPFARYLSTNRILKMKRYQVGNVFRRDNISVETGRLREFTQADFDIVGDSNNLNDIEVVKTASQIMEAFFKEYTICINDRRILTEFLKYIKVENAMDICSTIDKKDKKSMDELIKEFKEKNLNDEQIHQIRIFIEYEFDKIPFLEGLAKKMTEEASNFDMETFKKGINSLKEIVRCCEWIGVKNLKIDLGLARGLSYYTGLIMEATVPDTKVGSVLGGGRYDNLCSSISNHRVCCVGFSVGVSRIFTLLDPINDDKLKVFVGSWSNYLLEERLKILTYLWENNICADTFTTTRVNLKDQKNFCRKNGFKKALFIGDELSKDIISVVTFGEEEKKEDINVDDLIKYLLD